MSAKVEIAQAEAAKHLDAILKLFKPGAKITLLVRSPGFPDRDFMMTTDEPHEAVGMIQRRVAEGSK